MMVVEDRNPPPTLVEKVGVAMNAHSLESSVDFEGAADRLGGLGAATFKRDAAGKPLIHAEMEVVQRDRGRELLAYLWRLKYGEQPTVRRQCVLLLERMLSARGGRGRHWKAGRLLTVRFVVRVIDEWVNDGCPECGGRCTKGGTRAHFSTVRKACTECHETGTVEHWTQAMLDLLLHGDHDGQVAVPVMKPCPACTGRRWVSGTVKVGYARERACGACSGSGKRRLTDEALDNPRMAALQITKADYAYKWKRRFMEVHGVLSRVDELLKDGLQSEMKTGSIHSR